MKNNKGAFPKMNAGTLYFMVIALGVTALPAVAEKSSSGDNALPDNTLQRNKNSGDKRASSAPTPEKSTAPTPEKSKPEKSTAPTPEQIKELRHLFEDFVQKNPQVIKDSLENLLAKEAILQEQEEKELARKRIEEHKKDLFQNEHWPLLGSKNASKMVVLFIDPYCGHCHDSLKDLERLVLENKDIQVSIRHIDILGDASSWATKALIAAQKQGKYTAFQEALQKTKQPLEKSELIDMARTLRIDEDRFKTELEGEDVNRIFEENRRLADALHIIATPTLIIEDRMIQGYIPFKELYAEVVLPKKEPAEGKGKMPGTPPKNETF